ncbi:hypothetical protein HPB47_009979 [Ixodes persulcatus]|uniref:Uncharacterized protein n=1 Tax=Ixodes persulcatus TaxID=34615 RepID=A0AC60P0I3_IXOPE|nr:hypothetical protein HPB47_009979 [Ixodes persulcatus]
MATVRLPKLEIANYGRDIRLWLGFWGQFNSTIHQNEYPSDIDKFKYLKSYLIGRAAIAIEGLQLTTENYQVALDFLTQRFGQTDLIVEDHMSRLMAVRAVHDSRNVERLRTLLEALGVEEKTYGVLLLTVLRKAIPADIGLEYSHNELRGFLSFLKGEVECRERMQPVTEGTVRRRSNSDSAEEPRFASAAALTTTTGAHIRCVFCRTDDHGPDSCFSGMSLDNRRAVLQRENRSEAPDGRDVRGVADDTSPPCAIPTRKGRGDHSGEGGSGRRDFAVITRNLRQNNRTKQEPGAHADSKGVGRRLLLDCGSQRTFARRDISERLHLRIRGEEDLRIFTFGGHATTNPTTSRRVVVTQMKMEGKKIVDVTSDNAVKDGIGLLIGADYCWDVVTGSVRRLSPKLMAGDTVFGWTLQGQFGTTKFKAICSTATNVMRATSTKGVCRSRCAMAQSDGGGADEGPADGPVKGSYPPYLPELPELRVIIEEASGVEEPAEGDDGISLLGKYTRALPAHRKSTQRLKSTLKQTVGYRVFDHDEVKEVDIIITKRLEEETVDNDRTFSRRLDGAHKKRFADKQTPNEDSAATEDSLPRHLWRTCTIKERFMPGVFNVHHAVKIHDRTPVRCAIRSKRAGVGIEPRVPEFFNRANSSCSELASNQEHLVQRRRGGRCGMRSLLGGHADGGVAVPPSCTKVSLNPKKKEENTDLRTLATWWRRGGGEVQQEAVSEGMWDHRWEKKPERSVWEGPHTWPPSIPVRVKRAQCAEHNVAAASD